MVFAVSLPGCRLMLLSLPNPLWGTMNTTKRKLVVALCRAALVVALPAVGVMIPSQAYAKGCIKGAVVGGLAGHLVHHGVAGAVAGCVVGHHQAAKQRREHEQQNGGAPEGEGK